MALEENSSAESGSVSRRTIVKGAAWAAPVMIAAVAVPAAVATTHPTSATPSPVALGAGSQTVTFTLSPVPPTSSSVTVTLAGATYANGSTSTAVSTDQNGKVTVTVQPTASSGSFSLSGTSWGPIDVAFAAAFPTSITPSTFKFGSSSDTTVNLVLTPAPTEGTVVNVTLPTDYQFGTTGTNPRGFTVGANGGIAPVIKASGNANPGDLTVSGVGGWSVKVSLSRGK